MATKIVSSYVTPPFNYNNNVAVVPVGTRVNLDDGGVAVFMQAGSEVAQFSAVAVNVGWTAVNLTTAAITEGTGSTRSVGFAQTSIASGYYGWIQLSGRPRCNLLANCADQVKLFTTSTAGSLDDAVVSIGEVAGIVSKTTISNATAVTLLVPTEAFIKDFAVQA